MGKTRASWAIFRNALSVLNKNRTLLAFPVLITFFTLLMGLFFLAPVALQPTGHSITLMDHWGGHGTAYLTLIYFVSMFFSTFFNVAFCSQIFMALKGQPVSIEAGLQFAKSRVKEILVWSLFAGLVGSLIRKLEQQFGLFGRFVIGLIGLAWSVASVFAIPVIICEPVTANPMDILKKSAATIQRTWGEALIGFVGLQAGGLGFLLASLLILIAGGILSAVFTSAIPVCIAAILWIFSLVVFSYLQSIASLIYQCSLYLYASTSVVPAPFDAGMMDAAWKRS